MLKKEVASVVRGNSKDVGRESKRLMGFGSRVWGVKCGLFFFVFRTGSHVACELRWSDRSVTGGKDG